VKTAGHAGEKPHRRSGDIPPPPVQPCRCLKYPDKTTEVVSFRRPITAETSARSIVPGRKHAQGPLQAPHSERIGGKDNDRDIFYAAQ
jgi:hypothetical protein